MAGGARLDRLRAAIQRRATSSTRFPTSPNIQVQVLTNAPGLSPLEVEQLLVTRRSSSRWPACPARRSVRSTITLRGLCRHHHLSRRRRPRLRARSGVAALTCRTRSYPQSSEPTPSSRHDDHRPRRDLPLHTLGWPAIPRATHARSSIGRSRSRCASVPGVVRGQRLGWALAPVEVRLRPADMQCAGFPQALFDLGHHIVGVAACDHLEHAVDRFPLRRRWAADERKRLALRTVATCAQDR